MCASDGIARGVLAELRRLGLRVPGDVSVMGYDDLPLAAGCEPPLTTIRQDRLALGKSAFSLLDSLMNGVAVSKVLLDVYKRQAADREQTAAERQRRGVPAGQLQQPRQHGCKARAAGQQSGLAPGRQPVGDLCHIPVRLSLSLIHI